MKTLLRLSVGATRTARIWWATALLLGLSGCAGLRSPATADHSVVHASVAAGECRTTSETARSSDAPPKLERTARAALGAVKGALMGAVGGAGIGLFFAVANPAGCVEPTTCGAYVGGMVAGGAIAFSLIGAAAGAKTAWDKSSGVARNSHACTTGPEIRSSGNSPSGEAEAPHGSRSET
jgi:hypothetical protein